MPRGTGGILLAKALREHGGLKSGSTFLLHHVTHPPTQQAFNNGLPASQTVLGKMAHKALAQLGLTPRSMKFIHDGRHLSIEVQVK